MRAARTASSLGLSEAALTFLNRPGGFRRRRWRRLGANVGRGFRKRKRQLRARWRPAREPLKKPDVLHSAGADHQHLSLSRQRPLLATATERRAGTKLVEFDDRISSTKPAAIAILSCGGEMEALRTERASAKLAKSADKTLREAQTAKQSNGQARPWFRRTTTDCGERGSKARKKSGS